ncbi:MAG: hypothetical protein M0P58_02035 [Bacteroidales bacterium]|nr:hypothetical protein [Bacteroidales bacterium]
MSGYRKKDIVFFFILFFFTGGSFAQEDKSHNSQTSSGFSRWQVGVSIGPDFFYGDLNKYKIGISGSVSIAGGLFLSRQITPVFGVRGQVLAGGINGNKETNVDSNPVLKKFRGGFFEINVNGTINFSNLISKYKPSRKFFIYGTLGVGVTNWNTLQQDLVDDAVVSSHPDPRRWRTAAVVPFGLGGAYCITDKLDLNLEWTFRMVTSDLLDQTTGGFKFDFYDYLAIGVTFNLGQRASRSQKLLDYPYFSTTVSRTPSEARIASPEPANQPVYAENETYVYTVQIFAFEKHHYSAEWIRKKYKIKQPVVREKEGNISRYIIGVFTTLNSAKSTRDAMLQKGIHDAFVVAYKDGKRHHTVSSGF